MSALPPLESSGWHGWLNLPSLRIRDDDRMELADPAVYRDPLGRVWRVPRGFVTDLASVPAIVPGLLRLLIPGPIASGAAAIVHDWLYAQALVPRWDADRVFRWALLDGEESRLGAWLMFAAVRAGGWLAWRRHRSA